MNKMRIERVIAVLLIAIPGGIGMLGCKWVIEAVLFAFGHESFSWGSFFVRLFTDWHLYLGTLFFLFAIVYIGGFIFYRDAKQNRVQPRFRSKKKPQT